MRTTSSCLYWQGDFRATTQQEACQDELDREHAQKYTGLCKNSARLMVSTMALVDFSLSKAHSA